jgi:hypothetical protein
MSIYIYIYTYIILTHTHTHTHTHTRMTSTALVRGIARRTSAQDRPLTSLGRARAQHVGYSKGKTGARVLNGCSGTKKKSIHGYSKERRNCFGFVWHWLRVCLHTAGMARVVWQYISGTHGVLTGYSRGMYRGSRISRSWVRVLTWAVGFRFRVQTETLNLNRVLFGARRQRVARSCAPHRFGCGRKKVVPRSVGQRIATRRAFACVG